MTGIRKAIGFILIIIGILLSLSGIGAIIGIPMIIIGWTEIMELYIDYRRGKMRKKIIKWI